MGRFINADAYATTGQGILGNNMLTYCLNDPVNNFDPSGGLSFMALDREIQGFIPSSLLGFTGGGSYSSSTLSDYTHGDYALEKGFGDSSSNRYGAETNASKGYLYYDFLTLDDDGLTLVNGGLGLFKGTLSWWDGLVTLTPFDFFGSELDAGISISKGLHFSALAYTAAATGTLNLGFAEISVTGYAGAIGAEFAAGLGEVTIGLAPNGVGGSITIRWDTD